MNTFRLTEAIVDGGIQAINFFNGRLLSGEDLTQERDANRTVSRRQGQAIGSGVAFGLEVTEAKGLSTPDAPVVSVAPGLAVNGRGRTLGLIEPTNIAFVPAEAVPPATAGAFADCKPPQGGPLVTGSGVYLLVIRPATVGVDHAPVGGLGNVAAACNTRYAVEAVQFRLVQMPFTAEELNNRALLRNLVAARCFGVAPKQEPNRATFARDPFGPSAATYGLLDELRDKNLLTLCDVPLAAVCWVAGVGIAFIDLWSMRRRLTRPPVTDHWDALVGDRRRAEGEAMFLQFQDQVGDLAGAGKPEAVKAKDHFHWLPPVGLLPIQTVGSPDGFDAATFFNALASRDVATIDARLVRALLQEACDYEPIDLASAESNRERIQLYEIWENVQAVQAGQSQQSALLFASAALRYRGVARFGRARWTLSRFAPAVT